MMKRALVAAAVSTLPGLTGCASSPDEPQPEPAKSDNTKSTGSEEVSQSIKDNLSDSDNVEPKDCMDYCFDYSLGIYVCCDPSGGWPGGRPLIVDGRARLASIETRDDWAA